MTRLKRLLSTAGAVLLLTGVLSGQIDPNKQYVVDLVFWDKTDLSVTTWNWITSEYKKIHPNVTVNVKYQPHRGYDNWFRTQFIAGTAPDMLQMFPRNYQKQGPIEGNLVPLKQFYFKPSAYSKTRRWIDDFYSSLMVTNADPYYGELWSVPMGVTSVRMYYNKDLFERYGITSFPKTMSGFMAACETIKQKSGGKIVPMVTNRSFGWLIYSLNNSVLWEMIPRMDGIIPDRRSDTQEKVQAIYNGTVNIDDDLFYTPARIMRDLYVKEYVPEGFSGLDGEQADNIFINQQAAIIQNGSWALTDYDRKIAGDFRFGVAPYPALDSAYYPHTGGLSSEGMGTFGADICVSQLAQKRGNLEACIDFLQFYTSKYVVENNPGRGGGFPAVRNVKVHERSMPFKPVLYGARGTDILIGSGIPDLSELEGQARTAYIDGTISYEKYKAFVKDNYFNFMNKTMTRDIKDQKMGIAKACRAEAEFIYWDGLYRELLAQAADDASRAKLAAAQKTLHMRRAAVTDRREETEKKVAGLVTSFLKGDVDGYRHRPLITDARAAVLRTIRNILLLAAAAALLIYVFTGNRFRRLLAYDRKYLYLYVGISVGLLLVFNYTAALKGIYHAFTEWDGYKIDEFIGLKNFIEIFHDSVLARSVGNLAVIMAFFFVKMVPPILCSVILFHLASERMQYLFRIFFVLPMIIPWMVTMLIWKFLYQPEPYGAINNLLIAIGLENFTANWLADPNTALGAIIFLGFPWFNTVGVLIYLAGLENIPESVYDAAKIDGANALQRFWHVEFPLILRQVKINLVLGIVGTIQTYGQILILTGGSGGTAGGPLYATTVPGLRMYIEAFSNGRLGYASAIGFLLFLTILTLTLINVKFIKPKDA